MRIGIRQLKDRDLSRAIRRAQRGEEVIVTDRGIPIVRMLPADILGFSPTVTDLIARRLLDFRAPVLDELGDPVPLRGAGKSAVAYIEEQRR